MKYKIGTSDPPLKHDKGAGQWASETWTAEMLAAKVAILGSMPASKAVIGQDAWDNMWHYLLNIGAPKELRVRQMLEDVPSAKARYEAELAEAEAFVSKLPEGVHSITSAEVSHGYNTQSESRNWYFAVGGYSCWGKGVATVARDAAGRRGYKMSFEFHVYDRYNWDGGKHVCFPSEASCRVKVTDEFMGALHRQGMAQEFDMYGAVTNEVVWGATTAFPRAPDPPQGRL